ncbi:MAG: DUF4349 domain-containing protein, partial [Chloroflexi bacterium]|nr:DUF4349 domain-containing protein [Chloroflexota bacterium]
MELISVIERLDNSEQQAKGTIMSSLRIAIIIVLATALAFVFACGGSGESGYYDYSGAPGDLGAPGRAGAPGQPGAPIIATVVVEKAVMVEKVVEVEAQEAMMMAPAAAAAPTAAPMAMKMSDDQSAQNVDISFQPQNRIIVRNADMSVESNDPIATIDDIGDLAISRGGWVVNSNTSDHGFYNITIRIPADTLDDVIEQITVNVAKVISVNSDSTDFTEEYIDLGAR